MIHEKREMVLRCPICTLTTVRLPLIDEAGIDMVADPQSLQILRGGKIFRISGSQRRPTVEEACPEAMSLSVENPVLPDFGFRPGQYVWVSASAKNNYGTDRILRELPGRLEQK